MKKMMAFLCLTTAFLFCTALAEEKLPEVNYRGIQLGTTAGEITAMFDREGTSYRIEEPLDSGMSCDPRDLGTYTAIRNPAGQFTNTKDAYDGKHNDRAIIDCQIFVEEVAGHPCYESHLYFIRQTADGSIAEDADSLFYAGAYTLDISAEDDLLEKLTSIYGTPEKSKHRKADLYTWYGADNTAVYLTTGGMGTAGITYAWLGFDDVYPETYRYLEEHPKQAEVNTSISGL